MNLPFVRTIPQRLVALAAFAAGAIILNAPLRAYAQTPPTTTSITYKLTPSLSSDDSTLTLVITASNSLAPSTPAQTFTFNATTNETPTRSFSAVATQPAVSDLLTGPVVTIPIQQATSSLAGLTPPATLPPGVSITGNILTWAPGKLDGGATATVSVTFQVVQPIGGQGTVAAAGASHG